MIKKLFLLFFCALNSIAATYACDACGCSAGNLGIGLLVDYRSNFVRLSYFDIRYNSSPEHSHHTSSDAFYRLDLSFRYTFNKLPNFRFMGHIPYGFNERKSDGTQSNINGLSDARAEVSYVLLNNIIIAKKAMLYLEAGGGLVLPIGKYNADILDNNLPENFNLGNGSLGYLLQMNSVLSIGKAGLMLNNIYRLNSETQEGYHFGNQLNSQITAYREISWSKLQLIPNTGLLFEKVSSDINRNKNTVPETGGNGLFFSAALIVKTNKWLAGISYALPIDQNYSNSVIDAGRRLAIHTSFLF